MGAHLVDLVYPFSGARDPEIKADCESRQPSEGAAGVVRRIYLCALRAEITLCHRQLFASNWRWLSHYLVWLSDSAGTRWHRVVVSGAVVGAWRADNTGRKRHVDGSSRAAGGLFDLGCR